MNIKNLRKSILQYAVEGKLVQQNINDEPASILYDKIIKEKENLINQGQIKKEKPLPPVTDDEIPYNIPESWKWVRLGEVCVINKNALKNDTNSNYTFKYIDLSAVKCGKINIPNNNISFRNAPSRARRIIKKDDVIIATVRPNLKGFAHIDFNSENMIVSTGFAVLTPYNLLYSKFLYHLFYTELLSFQINNAVKGTSYPAINSNDMNTFIFPLPPLKEQERIVKKVDELMDLCDKLEQEEEKLLSLDKYFADNLPKSILQYAVEGKLVQQDIQDEPASILYDKIVKEKKNLINQGQIKKEKPMPPVTDDEIPYNIPENWKWVRLGEVCNLINGNKTTNINLPLLNAKYLRTRQEKQIYNEGIKVNKNDYIILVDGENSGEVFKAFEDGILGSTFKILNINSNIFENYILHILYFYKKTFKKQKKGAAIPHLDKELFKNILIPLPPLKEQERIVKKVDELLTYCNKLKDII